MNRGEPGATISAERRESWAVLLLLLAFTAAHVLLALHFPLAPDETYYWEWSRQLDWGYYDQGPLIAWLIRASTTVFGNTEFGVRAGVIACATIMLWFLYLAGRELFSRRAGLLAMLCAGLTPMGTVGGFVATYDVPLAMFWAASMYYLARAAAAVPDHHETEPKLMGWPYWAVLGIVTGLGMLSKYTMALAAPCALLFLAARSDLRPWLRRPQPYAALAIALVVFLPNLVWQWNHDWLSFAHMFGLTDKGGGHGPVRRFGDFLGSQAGLLTPFLFLGMVAAMWDFARRRTGRGGHGAWLTFCFSAPVLLLFVVLSLKTKVQANWAICGWIGAAVAYAGWVLEPCPAISTDAEPAGRVTAQPSPRVGRIRYAWAALAFAGVISFLAAWPELRVAIGLRIPARLDQSRKMYGGREVASACVKEIRAMERLGRTPVVGAATYDNASRLAFYLPGQPHVYCFFLGTRDNEYRFLNAAAGLRPGMNALIVDHRPPDDPLLPRFDTIFERVEPVPEPVIVHVPDVYDEPVVTYYLYRCYRYRPISSDDAN